MKNLNVGLLYQTAAMDPKQFLQLHRTFTRQSPVYVCVCGGGVGGGGCGVGLSNFTLLFTWVLGAYPQRVLCSNRLQVEP